MTSTQQVTAILKAAGFSSSVRTRKVTRKGYAVRKLQAGAVGILSDYADNPSEYSAKLEATLIAAGMTVVRPFPDPTILAVR